MSENWRRRMTLVTAMVMIGDGVVALTRPDAVRLWDGGPPLYRRLVAAFARHPTATRICGTGEAALGWWLARRVASV